MARTGNVYPVRAAGRDIWQVHGRFSSPGSAGNLTKVYGPQIASVNRNAATGKYIVTFATNPGAVLVRAGATAHAVTNGFCLQGNVLYSTYAVSADGNTASIQVEFASVNGTEALVDPLSAAHPTVDFEFTFAPTLT